MHSDVEVADKLYTKPVTSGVGESDELSPEITQVGGAIKFMFSEWRLTLTLARIRDGKRSGPHAELTVATTRPGVPAHLTTAHLSLLSLSGRQNFAKGLRQLCPDPPWGQMLEYVCQYAVRTLRTGEPATYLDGSKSTIGEAFVLNPLLYDRHPTLLYGPGDSGKSFFGLYCALLLSAGGCENGLACSDWPVLYLDWELAEADMDQRVALLKAGHPQLRAVRLAYRRLCVPLVDCLEDVSRTILETGARVLIIDSVALAAGADLEKADTAIRFFEALRSFNLPAFLIGHTAKNAEEKTPFGSVFFYNLSRAVWEVQTVQEPGSGIFRFGLYHKKCNLGPRRTPLGFQVAIQHGACTVTTCDLAEEPELARGLPIADQIGNLLKDGERRTAKEIAETLNLKLVNVKPTLSKYKGKRWQQVGLGGKPGSEAEWTC